MQVNPQNQFPKSKQDLPLKNPYFLLIQIFHLNYLKKFQKKKDLIILKNQIIKIF